MRQTQFLLQRTISTVKFPIKFFLKKKKDYKQSLKWDLEVGQTQQSTVGLTNYL